MTRTQLDKVMKPYWDLQFGNIELKFFDVSESRWFGFRIDDSIICGCPEEDIASGDWYYSLPYFKGGMELFDLTPSEFLQAMRRYLNETYNLEIKRIM
jgi:hypothetical protein